MKTLNKLLASAIALVGFATTTNAQATATATATATVITPISITKTTDMNFGSLAVLAATPGTVILLPDNTRTATGGVSLSTIGATPTAAVFAVAGSGASTYAITLPTTVTLTNTTGGGAETMTAGTFTSTPTPTGVLTAGAQNISVGATLSVAAAQVPGVYVSPATSVAGSLDVTVNYN